MRLGLDTRLPTQTSSQLIHTNANNSFSIKLTSNKFPLGISKFKPCCLCRWLFSICPPQPNQVLEPSTLIFTSRLDMTNWFLVLFATLSEPIVPFISLCKTSHEAMRKLTNQYASQTHSMIMSLKKKLSLISQGSKSITELG